ncbi:MAG TPA: flagellar biosynthetic protein FliO [Aquabacterium sp.]|nr:flagellar biosynthetic protein FliO [Aquabacterium sp.]HQC96841.1 flagellar biosynthetic protein FliO [Aquabacterium sp.]
MSGTDFLGPVVAFVAILALIPAALWLLKRTPMGGAANGLAPMRVVGALPLAPNQRLVTVEVGQGEQRRWLVLGVSPGGISTLHDMAPQADAPAAPAAAGTVFAQLLSKQRSGSGDAR